MKAVQIALLIIICSGLLFRVQNTNRFSKICSFGDAVTNPLLMGGLGYAIYNSGSDDQQRELKDLNLKRRDAFNQFYTKKNKLGDYLSKVENNVTLLNESMDYLESRLSSNVNALRETLSFFAKNDLPAPERTKILRRIMGRHADENNLIIFGQKNTPKRKPKVKKMINKGKNKSKKKIEDEHEYEEEEEFDDKGRRRKIKRNRMRRLNLSTVLNKRKLNRKLSRRYNLN